MISSIVRLPLTHAHGPSTSGSPAQVRPPTSAISPITKTNWEGTGVEPDVKVDAKLALKTAHLDALKKQQPAMLELWLRRWLFTNEGVILADPRVFNANWC